MNIFLLIAGLASFIAGILLLLKASHGPKYKFGSSLALFTGFSLLLLRLIILDPNADSAEKDRQNYSLARQIEAEKIGAQLKTLFDSGNLKSLVIFGPGEFERSPSRSSLQIIQEVLGPAATQIKFHKLGGTEVTKLSQLSSIIDGMKAGEGYLYIGGVEPDFELDPDELTILAENRRSQTWLCTASGNPKFQKSLLDAGVIDLVFKPVVKVGANNRITCECQVLSKGLSDQ